MRELKSTIETLNVKHREEMQELRAIIEGESLTSEQEIAVRVVSLTKSKLCDKCLSSRTVPSIS